jgi:hypothetical protein
MMWPMRWILALALLSLPAAADASCGVDVCTLDLSDLDEPTGAGWQMQLSFEAIDQDQPRSGTTDVAFQQIRRPDHDEIETRNRNWTLRLGRALGPAWSVGVELPVVHRQHSHVAVAGHAHDEGMTAGEAHSHSGVQRWDFTGVGDLVLRADHRLRSGARLGLGLRLPTGQTDVTNDAGAMAEPSLQPGAGG